MKRQGRYAMKITTRKLAEAAGVSPASVSRYMNGTEVVSGEIAQRIEAAVQLLGGEDMSRKPKKKLVLVLLTPLAFRLYRQVVEELLTQQGEYTFLLARCDEHASKLVRRLVSRLQPVGAIYFEEALDGALLRILEKGGVRTVMCGGTTGETTSDWVGINDITAAYDGVKYLLDLGHRDILFLCDESRKIGPGYQRATGCGKALEERGLTLSPERLLCGPMTFQAGYDSMARAIGRATSFTAVFAFSDELAVGAMAALYDAGVSVPGEVSVLGFDDLEIAAKVRPGLTTVHQPVDIFVQKTLELLEQPQGDQRTELLLPHGVTERGSCGPVKP